jgi:general secretion pathway protein M
MIRAWWQKQSLRDQRVLRWGALLAGALLFWFLGWDPAVANQQKLRKQVQAAETDLLSLYASRREWRALNQGGSANVFERGGRSLLAIADASAREARLGNALQRVEPVSAGRVNVWLQNASFDDAVLWLEQLHTRFGVRVESLAVERLQQAGMVDARVVLLDVAGE